MRPENEDEQEGMFYEVFFQEPGVENLLYFTVWATSPKNAKEKGLFHLEMIAGMGDCQFVKVENARTFLGPTETVDEKIEVAWKAPISPLMTKRFN